MVLDRGWCLAMAIEEGDFAARVEVPGRRSGGLCE